MPCSGTVCLLPRGDTCLYLSLNKDTGATLDWYRIWFDCDTRHKLEKLNPFFFNLIGNGFEDKAVEILAEAIKVSCQQKMVTEVIK